MAIVNAVTTVKNMLSNNWTAANTDNITPTIDFKENVKRVNAHGSVILIYQRAINDKKMGLGWSVVNRSYEITIDVHTTKGKAHYVLLQAEIERILNADALNPGDSFNFLDPDGLFTDVTNYPNYNHGSKEIRLIKYIDSR